MDQTESGATILPNDESQRNAPLDVTLNLVKTEPATPPHYTDYHVYTEGNVGDVDMKTEPMIHHEPSEDECNAWNDVAVPVAIYKSVMNSHDSTVRTEPQCVSHRGEKLYKCSTCSYATVYERNLKRHEQRHTGERPYRCSICLYSAARKGTLERHVQSHIAEAHRVVTKAQRQTHKKTRVVEKPYKCTVCSYSAAQKGHLKTHVRTHTGEKPYRCTICSYSTAHPGSLKKHERTHIGGNAHVQVSSAFSYSAAREEYLAEHPRTHTEEESYMS